MVEPLPQRTCKNINLAGNLVSLKTTGHNLISNCLYLSISEEYLQPSQRGRRKTTR